MRNVMVAMKGLVVAVLLLAALSVAGCFSVNVDREAVKVGGRKYDTGKYVDRYSGEKDSCPQGGCN